MESKDFNSIISFKMQNKNGHLVSINGQSNTFGLSIKEMTFFWMTMTILKSRYQKQSKPKTHEIQKKEQTYYLQTIKQKLISGSGFLV